MSATQDSIDVRRRAGWLPPQPDLEAWLDGHCERVAAKGDDVQLHPVIQEFRQLIDTDAVVRLYVHEMVEQIPTSRNYEKRHVHGVDHLLRLMNEVLTMAPEFAESSMLTTPLAAVLDWTMATPSGFAAYRDHRINAMIGKILGAWSEFLSSPRSLYVLNESPSGWMSEQARSVIGIDQFVHDPDDQHWGFTSWNDFFTRRLAPDARPVAAPDDDAVIVNACEASPYALASDVQLQDRFWIKDQPYSLQDMLAGDEAAERFVGGTVYQAFLSAMNYHRWHSPVSGTIVRAFVQPGTYYSESDAEGRAASDPTNSQGYMAHVAARAIVLIEADDPAIGLVGFVPVGMADVSSCMLDERIRPGAHVSKGDELGWFQFGGSTYCLLLQPGVADEIRLDAVPEAHGSNPPVIPVRSHLLRARS